ncbi:MAG: UbiX family flavin prenyltransferase [Thermoanaerobaculales bacterium]|nr:UbiX family flavin prenyltransferase [Thermoanaerobaculales bacterium]
MRGNPREFALIVSGASGMVLARRFAEIVLENTPIDVLHLVVTAAAAQVLAHELGGAWATADGFRDQLALSDEEKGRVQTWSDANLGAPIASGSHLLEGTVVLPCSAGMAGAISLGISRGLAQRAADVALKQHRPLVIGVRESPLSEILLKNLLRLARAGAHIVPPMPAFYLKTDEGRTMDRFVDHYCLRVLDLLGIHLEGSNLRWPPR